MRIDLADEKHLVAAPGYRLGDQLLGATLAIHFGGVDERGAKIEAQAQGRDFLGARGAALADVPGALAEGGNAFTARQQDGFHRHGQSVRTPTT